MSKAKKIVIGVLVVALLLGTCFTTLAIYAKKTLNAPKFSLPEEEPQASASVLPQEKAALCDYVNGLWAKTVSATNAEGSWHTDVDLGGEIVTPFDSHDQAIVTFVKDNSAGQIAELYPNESAVVMKEAENAPEISINAADVTEFTAEQGHTDDEGNVYDDAYYFITFVMNPAVVDTASIPGGEIFKGIEEKLSDAASVEKAEVTVERYEISFKIDRVTDQILNVDVYNDYHVKADVKMAGLYGSLLKDGSDTAAIELPYKTAQRISFRHYGARFTQRSIAVRPNDMKALPADVKVKAEATKDEFKLTFTPSNKDAVTIDEDGVMTVNKKAVEAVGSDGKITIDMKLEYEGETYTDQLIVYITELEVETNV